MIFKYLSGLLRASLVAQMVTNLPATLKTQVLIPGLGRSLEKRMTTHSSILPWRISGTEESGRLQSMGSHRVRHDWATNLSLSGSLGCNKQKFTQVHIEKLKHKREEIWWHPKIRHRSAIQLAPTGLDLRTKNPLLFSDSLLFVLAYLSAAV